MEKVLSESYSLYISKNLIIDKYYFDNSVEDTEEYLGIKSNTRYTVKIESINKLFEIIGKDCVFSPEYIKELMEAERICLGNGRISKWNSELVANFLLCFPKLKEIEFYKIKMTDFSWLPNMPEIESVRCFNCNIRNMKGIDSLFNLKHIWFRGNCFLNTLNLHLLKNLPELIIFQSYWNTYKSLKFVEKMTSLEALHLIGCWNLAFNTLRNLNSLTNLKILDLRDGGEIRADISKLYKLEYLSLGNPSIKYVPNDRPKFDLDMIKGLHNLKKVCISKEDLKESENAKVYEHLLNNELKWQSHNSLLTRG